VGSAVTVEEAIGRVSQQFPVSAGIIHRRIVELTEQLQAAMTLAEAATARADAAESLVVTYEQIEQWNTGFPVGTCVWFEYGHYEHRATVVSCMHIGPCGPSAKIQLLDRPDVVLPCSPTQVRLR
jgi:hypothetical protein